MRENSNYRWYHFKGGLYIQTTQMWGRSSAGRASRSQCEGREFDPPRLHQMTDSFQLLEQRDGPLGNRYCDLFSINRLLLVYAE